VPLCNSKVFNFGQVLFDEVVGHSALSSGSPPPRFCTIQLTGTERGVRVLPAVTSNINCMFALAAVNSILL
jgi:hypothetical protein